MTSSLLLLLLAWSNPEFRHPADGPDVDLRITVGEESVRLAVTMNLAFVDEIVPMARESRESVHPAEESALSAALLARLREGLVVTIDGVKVPPELADFAVDAGEVDLLPLMPNFGLRALTRCRLLLDHPLTGSPRSVGITWGHYPPNWAETGYGAPDTPPLAVKAQVFAEGIVEEITFLREEPEYVWRASGKSWRDRLLAVPSVPPPPRRTIPLGSLLCLALAVAGGVSAWRAPRRRPWLWALPLGLLGAWFLRSTSGVSVPDPWASPDGPTAEEARSIFLPLHANVYRAFAFTEDTAIYDVLAESVAGDLLEETFDAIHESLILREHGGAICRVTEVRPLDVQIESVGFLDAEDVPGFRVHARWEVDGRVTHWGHSHERRYAYEARYAVAQRPEGWRIVGSEVLSQRRFDPTGADEADR